MKNIPIRVPINEGDCSINVEKLEEQLEYQNLIQDQEKTKILVLAEINNNLNAIRIEKQKENEIAGSIRKDVNDLSQQILPKAQDSKENLRGPQLVETPPNLKDIEDINGVWKRMGATEQRPWGGFEVLAEGEGYKVKRIWVNPGEAISLQSHKKRDEAWTIIKGAGKLTCNGRKANVSSGKNLQILRGLQHRVENPYAEVLEFIEVQTGECREDDITRYEDKYGRV